jgi:hypothetical protein
VTSRPGHPHVRPRIPAAQRIPGEGPCRCIACCTRAAALRVAYRRECDRAFHLPHYLLKRLASLRRRRGCGQRRGRQLDQAMRSLSRSRRCLRMVSRRRERLVLPLELLMAGLPGEGVFNRLLLAHCLFKSYALSRQHFPRRRCPHRRQARRCLQRPVHTEPVRLSAGPRVLDD